MMKNKKAIAPIVIVLIIAGIVLLFYIILFLPIPSFKAIRYSINYWALLILFFTFQVGLVYLYYKVISVIVRGYSDISRFVHNLSDRFSRFVKTRIRI